MNTMKWLLRREYWEHKGGMFWAPAVISALLLGVALFSVIAGKTMGKFGHMEINGVQVTSLAEVMTPEKKIEVVNGIASSFVGTGTALFIAMSFVVFFYLIGALYDDRSNRSVLFWKSLPISDRDTVLSKVASAVLMAPLITWAIATVSGFGLAFIACIGMGMAGVNLFGAVLGNVKLYTLPFEFLACLPVYVLWALPTVGWLLMVSAWARTKPFLWAVGAPLLVALVLSWAKALFDLPVDMDWVMHNLVGRGLLGVIPGMWFAQGGMPNGGRMGHSMYQDADSGMIVAQSWQALASVDAWIGVAAGVAMIALAIRLRRYRDEG